jgi:hypothetical protein
VAKFTIVISMLLGTSYVPAWSVGLSLEKSPYFRTGKTLRRFVYRSSRARCLDAPVHGRPRSFHCHTLPLAGARRIPAFTHGIALLPALLGISLYCLDENIRSSLVLGFVAAGGIGFQLSPWRYASAWPDVPITPEDRRISAALRRA